MLFNYQKLFQKNKCREVYIVIFTIVAFLFSSSLLYAKTNKNKQIIEAVSRGNVRQLEKLINGGININQPLDPDGRTALYYAVASNQLQSVNLLIAKGAEVDIGYKDGVTCLMNACANGYIDIAEALIVNGHANIEKENKNKFTALSYAKHHKQKDVVGLLLLHGANSPENQEIIMPILGGMLEKLSFKDEGYIQNFKDNVGIYCQGLTFLWLYSKWFDTQTDKNEEFTSYWFKNVVRGIANYDETKKLTKSAQRDFKNFAKLVHLFQFPIYYNSYFARTDFLNALRFSGLDTNGKTLQNVYGIAAEFTKLQLVEFLTHNIYDDDLATIATGFGGDIKRVTHMVGLFKHNGEYYYYNSSSCNWEIKKSSAEEMAEVILNEHKNYRGANESLIAFTVYSFDDSHQYTNPKEFLNGIKAQANEKALILSAFIGAIDSVRYYLDVGVPVGATHLDNGADALFFASQQGYSDVVQLLIENRADPYKRIALSGLDTSAFDIAKVQNCCKKLFGFLGGCPVDEIPSYAFIYEPIQKHKSKSEL